MTRPVVLGLLTLAACQAPLDPIAPSDLVFSLSGYLDASADTQWVRVEPFGRTVDPADRPLAAEVELVAPDGRRERLTQVVRRLVTGPAHLFWTTAPVEPGRTYRLVARDPGGAEARTDVAIPSLDDVTVALLDGFLSCPTLIQVEGAARLVDAWARYELRGAGRVGERYEFDKRPSLAHRADGTRDASVYFGDDAARMEIPGLPLEYPVVTEIGVAIGTADWPDVAGLGVEEALAEVSLGSVEGGVGFVGGVVTRVFPFVPGFGRIPPYEGSGIEPEPCVSGPRVGAE